MEKFKIAHVREQGQQIIIVLLNNSFDRMSEASQHATIESLQRCAIAAKLAGKIVPVWPSGSTFKFIAPTNWHPYFKSVTYEQIVLSVNKELTCG